MERAILDMVDQSLQRCFCAGSRFIDGFYERFLESSPTVREKFARTDFGRQKRHLRASLWMMLMAAEDEVGGPGRYLPALARRHGRRGLDIGAELYDLWLDSLLASVAECDPDFTPQIRDAWEQVMMVGIHYMCTHREA
jgi:hemoglobin-like flavoprotein